MASTEKLLPIAKIFKVLPFHFVSCKVGASVMGVSLVESEAVVVVTGASVLGGSVVEGVLPQDDIVKTRKSKSSAERSLDFMTRAPFSCDTIMISVCLQKIKKYLKNKENITMKNEKHTRFVGFIENLAFSY